MRSDYYPSYQRLLMGTVGLHNMDLNARHLTFLKKEMIKIKNDRDRDGEDRNNAAEILGAVEQDIEWKENRRHEEGKDQIKIESARL